MAYELKMAKVQAILGLRAQGWSCRRIARELGINRETVGRYVRLALSVSNPATASPGGSVLPPLVAESDPSVGDSKPASALTGNLVTGEAADSKPATALTGNPTAFVMAPGCGDVFAGPAEITAPLLAEPSMVSESGSTTVPPGKAPCAVEWNSKPAIALTGNPASSERVEPSKPATAPPGTGEEIGQSAAVAELLAGSALSGLDLPFDAAALSALSRREPHVAKSQCEPHRESIERKLEVGLSAQRIYQDLTTEGISVSYHSVRRFVAKLVEGSPEQFRRLECGPGEEAQVDFGSGARVLQEGKYRRPHVFRIVLSHSRKAYSEAVWRQTTENFLRCLENAFRHFGGVPRTLVIDNLKAAVKKGDWYDPELHPKIQSFCDYYKTAILPTKPYTPRHKGKVERGVGYVKDNGLKGHLFTSLEEENQHLLNWETQVADRRIHGTTRKQVGLCFERDERSALLPLPAERFPNFQEAKRTVHRDSHVEVDRAYYSAPAEHLGRVVWVRWDAQTVRIFNLRMEQIALHLRRPPGKFSTDAGHYSGHRFALVEEGQEKLLQRAALIGAGARRWGESMLQARGIQGIRVLVGLLSLARNHSSSAIEWACLTARMYEAYQLSAVRRLLDRLPATKQPVELLEEHPLIRPLSEYQDLLRHTSEKENMPCTNRCESP